MMMMIDNTVTEAFKGMIDTLFEESDRTFKDVRWNPTNRDLESILSKENLDTIIDRYGDTASAKHIPGNDNRITFDRRIENFDYLEDVTNAIAMSMDIELISSSGLFWYPPGGYCGWHTNNNREGERLYLAWAYESNKSFFRKWDSEKNEIITEWDKEGLNIHRFTVSKENPCWHCVGSHTNRFSLGFNLDIRKETKE
tara:strand:+ start:1543 stop:2136 length:594 start_codon:yes stop_codon:yes gene_type:complete